MKEVRIRIDNRSISLGLKIPNLDLVWIVCIKEVLKLSGGGRGGGSKGNLISILETGIRELLCYEFGFKVIV